MPRYSQVEKIAEDITYTVRAVANCELNPWPDLSVEKCVSCGLPPGTEGCMKVGLMYGDIQVDHTNKVDEATGYSHRSLVQEKRKTSSGSSFPPSSLSRDVSHSGSEEDSISSQRQASLSDGSEIQRQQVANLNRSASQTGGGAVFEEESYQSVDTSEGFEHREVTVDIEPGHSADASLVSTRSGGTLEGVDSEIEALNLGESSA